MKLSLVQHLSNSGKREVSERERERKKGGGEGGGSGRKRKRRNSLFFVFQILYPLIPYIKLPCSNLYHRFIPSWFCLARLCLWLGFLSRAPRWSAQSWWEAVAQSQWNRLPGLTSVSEQAAVVYQVPLLSPYRQPHFYVAATCSARDYLVFPRSNVQPGTTDEMWVEGMREVSRKTNLVGSLFPLCYAA